ncbi:Type II restriction/modification system, DNA methylase subunit YeeA [Hymenobacter daecheongensis DSM 21074]|uniref:site-specific DNA-methyltransferase (adenine-specific) n=1 Tax=Hymenobacter daecheongensis DSM 21074 TaxID=1121955 RepID=A0A1M6L8R3_9BACT|nr:DNA methyltransferase [Hymenobacter daecheongensis]SHJ67572.1 Type II restriction/modification system, DNA methylase subunit YeeA [Hymenobacter daecheongensis DSM 21074]
MPLSLSEVKDRAIRFAQEWQHETREHAEAKAFWGEFFNVFGVNRRRVATFEEPVKKLSGQQGFIDLLWKGTLLVEHKSRGKDLDKAGQQAKDYFPGLQDHELPKYILVSDFARFRLYDLDEGTQHDFGLSELHQHLHLFSFLTGYQKRQYQPEDPANIRAAELMGELHDALLRGGYHGHKLEVLLVRILFCLFAEDTAIFEKDAFRAFLEEHTRPDGSDVGTRLAQWFEVLDQAPATRQRQLPDYLQQLPYVNGSLFTEFFPFPAFDAALREQLIRCTYFDWSRISPAIFGSLFQSVTDPVKRRNLGAHYTSEANILKVIQGLFLDELRQELAQAGQNRPRLNALHLRLEKLRFLDPSCGCGNFLVVTYRELRLLEQEILERLFADRRATGQTIDLALYARVQVDQAYGIEVEEFPARIAEVAMWLMDHQLNLRLSEAFGNLYLRLPLTRTARIVHGNALTTDWETVAPKDQLSYILGNPPFIGQSWQTKEQRAELAAVAGNMKSAGILDYVSAWFLKAAQYIQGTAIKVAFVSTNSITQGEHVPVLWGELVRRYGVQIHFAHRTFKWGNEAKNNAAVYCVIVGFGLDAPKQAMLYDYATPKSEAQGRPVRRINAYLIDTDDAWVTDRSKPLSQVPPMIKGSQPTDGGNLLMSDAEKEELVAKEPQAAAFIKPLLGAREFLYNEPRWCLWLKGAGPSELKSMPLVRERIQRVKEMRLASTKESTRKWANFPQLFTEDRQPDSDYLLIPGVTSENRKYIPVGFMSKEIIATDLCRTIPNATPYLFGVFTSQMHMAWMRQICGRLKSDFRYSGTLVYNNFPFPPTPTPKQTAAVEAAAQQVLAARAQFPQESLATLYDPLTMPPVLVKAHQQLDRAVDLCYRSAAFPTELSRLEFLFEHYRQLQAPLLPPPPKAGRKAPAGR